MINLFPAHVLYLIINFFFGLSAGITAHVINIYCAKVFFIQDLTMLMAVCGSVFYLQQVRSSSIYNKWSFISSCLYGAVTALCIKIAFLPFNTITIPTYLLETVCLAVIGTYIGYGIGYVLHHILKPYE